MKNTVILYLRMIFQMAVYLYTSRVVIKALGLMDYGIYDVVGSVVMAMMFFNNSMLNCTQRFITCSLAEDGGINVKKIFSHSIFIHLAFGLLIFVVGELLGVFYIQNYMDLPAGRVDDALFVFHMALLSSFIMTISVPYNALIIAHEHMGAFAAITIVDVLLKLSVALSLFLFDGNRLRMYALLLLVAALLVRSIYGIYCHCVYKGIRVECKFDKKTFRSMLGFVGWNTIGNMAIMCNTQGLNLILNMVGGPIVNAARGIAFQVQTATVSFINSFQTAINPQITKNYASGDRERMNSLVLLSSRVSFLLMLFLAVPLMLMTENLLSLWLTESPSHTATFVRLLLCVSMVETVANPLMVGAAATGKIKRYQLTVGTCMLCTIPLAYVALILGYEPQAVFWSLLFTTFVAQLLRMHLCRGLFGFSIRDFSLKVLLPISIVCLTCFLPLVLLRPYYIDCVGINNVFVCIALDIWVLLCVLLFGLSNAEREFILQKIGLK